MAPVKVVVVGGGRIGTIHLHNLQRNPRAQVTFTIDVDEARAQAMAAQAGCQASTNLSDVLKNHPDQVDAVIICSPTAHHFSQVKECIEHGKAILCEKPLSMDVAEIEEAYALATEKNVPLLCGYQRRHDRSFSALVHMIRNNDIGSCHVIKSTSRDNPVPQIAFLKISGGIMHDCASHDIDVIRWVSGEDPVEVYCVANAFNPEIAALDDFDTVLATLKLPSGALGTIDLARHAPYGYDQRIEVLGETGMLQAENLKPTTVVRSTALGETKDPNCYSFPQRYEITYALELDHFIDMIQKGVPPIVTGDDCRKTAIIADAATESLKTGKPVTIDYSKRFQGH